MSTMGATPARAGAAGEQDPSRTGMLVFIMSEAVLFTNLIAAYLYLRFSAVHWFPGDVLPLYLGLPAANTIILLSSSIPVHWATLSIQRGNRRNLIIGLALTFIMGAIFIGGQAYEWTHAGFTPQGSVFGSTFFTLTGFHGAHVLVGLTFLAVTLVRALRGRFTAEHHFAVQAAGWYWHFVDAVWVFLFGSLYLL
ncbi:MAG: cytochrome c oxidase subunit 3 [Chloroflexi bacterium]|nr:cytochrome c oxidase subunit 3 [Chloroflexota bacterium]MCL5110442.1 cytochrome c oxidase subunit 3 [Chloroflexota bacterium]